MSEKTPYEKLGVSETAPFEEIQKAKDHLSQKHSDSFETMESIESAYDAIVMERLKLRQEGKVSVPDNIRFAEHQREISSKFPVSNFKSMFHWVQQFIDIPSFNDILLKTGIFLALSLLVGFLRPQSSLTPLFLALGVFVNIYFLNKKENKFNRALLITLTMLSLGMIIGGSIIQLFYDPNTTREFSQSFVSIIVFFIFWLSSSFLH
ncbi:CPP1-like family protein [Candidatus Atelocyanobacterium thalassae]|uniref:Molecular chaperone DnaJ n=1 Tax=cyanobacterium endosymbiont of Braarudosphaera bigelowii TaxID=1285375 RepID=A0ABM7UCV5_9CHRO|nr:CPP1-like family protein [Candidatus Atelocyanobacterium thalassa]BDA40310.1 hypothetical protein CPARK_000114800 [cyanobacterium endosymbiont of Braarudosphaera bigelowii]